MSLALIAFALVTVPGAGCVALDDPDAFDRYGDDGEHADGDPAVSSESDELAGTFVITEPTSDTAGAYPEVMSFDGACTGTIVGPHAVLTAQHCPAGSVIHWPSTGAWLTVAGSLASPYVSSAFWPRWWRALNTQQIQAGGRTDDWPAQHDLRIAFVPGLTPAWIAAHLRDSDVRSARIDPYAPSTGQTAVGVCSNGCGGRDFVNVHYAPSVPNSITSKNRDGYFNYADAAPFFDDIQQGDSGGPALGASVVYWPAAGGGVSGPRHVVSTHQGQGGGGYSDAGHNAPLAYNIDVALTPNQRYTVRLNQLWARAAISDADRDGLPLECDSNPASGAGSTNLCPLAMGSTDITAPRGLLQCDPGYVATGIRGREGWLIDELAVRCTPTVCLRSAASCASEYWTDPFAGESGGGGAFTKTCAAGRAITYVRGRHTAGSQLNELQLWCNDYAPRVDSGATTGSQDLGRVGNGSGTLGYGADVPWQSCSGGVFTGFEARSNLQGDASLFWLTGVQPICSGSIRESVVTGSTGGGFTNLECPANFVGVGFVTAPYSPDPGYVGMLGLLCMDKSELGATPSDNRLVVVHGSYYVNPAVYPAKAERYNTFKNRHGLGGAFVERKCPAGRAVTGAFLSSSGTFLNYFNGFTCADSTGAATWIDVGVGAQGGSPSAMICPGYPAERVAGLRLHSGWLTDGAALVCRPN